MQNSKQPDGYRQKIQSLGAGVRKENKHSLTLKRKGTLQVPFLWRILFLRNQITPSKIHFRFGTYEWLEHYGIPISLFIVSLISLTFLIIEKTELNNKIISLLVFSLLLGIITYYIQLNKLKFRKIGIEKDLKNIKKDIISLLKSNNWEIKYNNDYFLQAEYRGRIFNFELLTFRFTKKHLLYNLITMPGIGPLFSLVNFNKHGKEIIRKIKLLIIE